MSALAATYGAWLVGLLIAIESIGIPVPGETSLIGSAIYAGTTQRLSIGAILAAAILGAVIGSIVGYWIGRRFGYRLLVRYGHYIHLTESRLKIGQYLFLRYGISVVVLARFVPVLRSIAGLLAGANHMPVGQFAAATTIGAAAWVLCIGLTSYYFGEELVRLSILAIIVVSIGALLLVAAIGVLIARNERHLQIQADNEIPGPLPPH
jgi:membrane protein DedA with SNARE-associated domain